MAERLKRAGICIYVLNYAFDELRATLDWIENPWKVPELLHFYEAAVGAVVRPRSEPKRGKAVAGAEKRVSNPQNLSLAVFAFRSA